LDFIAKLRARWTKANSLLCVGLDPDAAKLPVALRARPDALFEFGTAIIDATHDLVCAYKPQIAYYAAQRAEEALARTLEYLRRQHPDIPVILDAKRGDIDSTAEQYAREAFERYGADAVTVNPYLGGDALAPFTRYRDRGVAILCRTSNPGAQDLQDLPVDGEPLYLRVARKAAHEWNPHGNCLLVVGATWPQQLRSVRALVGDMPLLVPGVGKQGGDVPALVQAGRTADGTGLIINSSRAILYASDAADYAQAARGAALATRELINRHR
jgi:orotidine-5'-phosphate decarboxylase